jgi:MFS family permease
MAFRNMATVVMVMLAASCALFPLFGSSLPVAVMTCVLLGLTIGAMYTVTACVIRQLFGNERFGFVFGALTSVMALASASGPLLGSAVHDRTGSYDGVYWVGVAVAILSAVILRTLRPVVAMPTA